MPKASLFSKKGLGEHHVQAGSYLMTDAPDLSGVVNSDHPKPDDGWIKGWLAGYSKIRDVIVVERHAGPSTISPNNRVFIVDKKGIKHERTIVRVINFDFNVADAPGLNDLYHHGDISVCKVDRPFPKTCQSYKIGSPTGKIYTKTDTKTVVTGLSKRTTNKAAWLIRDGKNTDFIAGDSGQPWFSESPSGWKVVSHTTKGWWGEGPNYSHKRIKNKLIELIKTI